MSELSRRSFIERLSFAGLVGGVGAWVAGCGGASENGDASDAADASGSGGVSDATDMAADESFSCMDTSGLEEADITMRTTLQYTDTSPMPDKDCENCVLYVQPAAGSNCGTCQTVKGPIHPLGYCTIWAAQTA